MGGKRGKSGLGEKLKGHPTQQTLEDLYRRKLTMQQTLLVFEHTSTCNRCYQKLLRIMTAKQP